jgi:hypothetical protein
MKATKKDLQEISDIVSESMKAKRGSGSYSDRVEEIALTYDNVEMNDIQEVVIRLKNGTYYNIWDIIK